MAVAGNGKNGCLSANWVKLNVGGQVFLTTKTTLTKEPDSFLARLSREEPDLPSDKDDQGAYMIDRDPKYFSPILNYLRHGKLIIEDHISAAGVLEEAEFYNIKSLVPLLRDKLQNKPKSPWHRVYRVLQTTEEELAHTISNMTDGWQFEQILSVGSNYQYGPDEQGEYICIVSCLKGSNNSGGSEETNGPCTSKVFQLRGS